MTALTPLESRHPRLGQSLWWLWVMRPRCLHAHAAPAGVLVCPAGRPGEVPLPSVASSPRAGGGTGSGRRAPLGYVPLPSPGFASLASWGLGFVLPPPSPPVFVCRGFHHFYQVSRLSHTGVLLYGHTGVLGSGCSPL